MGANKKRPPKEPLGWSLGSGFYVEQGDFPAVHVFSGAGVGFVVRHVDFKGVQKVKGSDSYGSEASQKVLSDEERQIRSFLPVKAVDLIRDVNAVHGVSEEAEAAVMLHIDCDVSDFTRGHVPRDTPYREIRKASKELNNGFHRIGTHSILAFNRAPLR
jgi:hypothetical protein